MSLKCFHLVIMGYRDLKNDSVCKVMLKKREGAVKMAYYHFHEQMYDKINIQIIFNVTMQKSALVIINSTSVPSVWWL